MLSCVLDKNYSQHAKLCIYFFMQNQYGISGLKVSTSQYSAEILSASQPPGGGGGGGGGYEVYHKNISKHNAMKQRTVKMLTGLNLEGGTAIISMKNISIESRSAPSVVLDPPKTALSKSLLLLKTSRA